MYKTNKYRDSGSPCRRPLDDLDLFVVAPFYKIERDGDGAGIPEPVGDGDEIQFFIPVGYG
ncbi:hypothetical protein MTR_2g085095 [Medicago truncatula]|uniref:Uncharacterized protein n=1 Tax=Medicago truncatula TaxID=3880 RepID=A0A072VBI7_MEDTR|nr:hypothetical protein MTR_2g085095 [Medicago truncatula]